MDRSLRTAWLVASLLALTASSAHAQDAEIVAPAPKATSIRIGADAAFVLPVGDYADLADFGVGALARIEFDATPELAIGGRFGYVWHASDFDLGLVPIHATARYRFGPAGAAPFVRAELGVTVAWVTAETAFGNASDSDTNLSAAFGGGYEAGAFDIGLSLFLPDIDDAVGVMLTAGGTFAEI
jgi:hypothetical protein